MIKIKKFPFDRPPCPSCNERVMNWEAIYWRDERDGYDKVRLACPDCNLTSYFRRLLKTEEWEKYKDRPLIVEDFYP